VIGIVGNNPPEEVVLRVADSQIGYFRTYPWHESTRIDKNEKGEWVVRMRVGVNYELQQLILMNHSHVKVLKPQHLAKDIKEMLAKASEQYS
jgi:predicted DNA-binding transcriptional regulator YafY